jgi:lipoyl(octanoyl) transferase
MLEENIHLIDASQEESPESLVLFESKFLGRKDFSEVAFLQKKVLSQIKNSGKILLFGMDFNALITLGLRARKECDLVPSFDDKYRSLPVVSTDRGGFATIHSPGQLIIYPMIDLKYHQLGIKKFIDILFQTTKELLSSYNIESDFDSEKPGLYTKNGKISFVGIKVDQGVVRHGIAINVNNDLDLFSAIRSCGIRCQSHDRIKNYVNEIPLDVIFSDWVSRFKIKFDFEVSK